MEKTVNTENDKKCHDSTFGLEKKNESVTSIHIKCINQILTQNINIMQPSYDSSQSI